TGGTAAIWTSSAALPAWPSQADGTYTVQATATDLAGNTFTGAAASFTLDYTPSTLGNATTPAVELDGKAAPPTQPSWGQVYNDAVLHPGQNTSGSIPGAVAFIHDPVNANSSGTDNIFTGGQSKDTNDVNQWLWTMNAPQDKADLADAFAVAYQVQSGGRTHPVSNFRPTRHDNKRNTPPGFSLFP